MLTTSSGVPVFSDFNVSSLRSSSSGWVLWSWRPSRSRRRQWESYWSTVCREGTHCRTTTRPWRSRTRDWDENSNASLQSKHTQNTEEPEPEPGRVGRIYTEEKSSRSINSLWKIGEILVIYRDVKYFLNHIFDMNWWLKGCIYLTWACFGLFINSLSFFNNLKLVVETFTTTTTFHHTFYYTSLLNLKYCVVLKVNMNFSFEVCIFFI